MILGPNYKLYVDILLKISKSVDLPSLKLEGGLSCGNLIYLDNTYKKMFKTGFFRHFVPALMTQTALKPVNTVLLT